MEPKATTFEEAAQECVAALTQKDIDYFRMHIDYNHHHFGYGLYLRNRYSYLMDKKLYSLFGDHYRDELGAMIYHLMLPLMFPEYKGHEKYISKLEFFSFGDLNANYNLRFGKNFIVDIPPEKYFLLPDDSPMKKEDFEGWKKKKWAELVDYSLAIAENIWQFDSFKQTAAALGYSISEMDEIHSTCVELMSNKFLFVPLEILFVKHDSEDSLNALMKYPKMIEWLFSNHESKVKLLPEYVFENRDVVKIMVSANGSLLQLVPIFSSDGEIVLAALSSSTYAAKFMDKSLWGDREIATEAARHADSDLMFGYEAFKPFNDDDEIVRLALEANGANICYASERIRSDYDMAVLALTHQREIFPNSAYESLSDELRSRKDLALLELEAPRPSLDGFTDELLDDDDIAELLMDKGNTRLFFDLSDRLKLKYLERFPEWMQKRIKEDLSEE